jgi:hypothetical protein
MRLSVERPNISKHLAVLKEAGIVCCRDEGLKRIYSLALPVWLGFRLCRGRARLDRHRLSSGPCGCAAANPRRWGINGHNNIVSCGCLGLGISFLKTEKDKQCPK